MGVAYLTIQPFKLGGISRHSRFTLTASLAKSYNVFILYNNNGSEIRIFVQKNLLSL